MTTPCSVVSHVLRASQLFRVFPMADRACSTYTSKNVISMARVKSSLRLMGVSLAHLSYLVVNRNRSHENGHIQHSSNFAARALISPIDGINSTHISAAIANGSPITPISRRALFTNSGWGKFSASSQRYDEASKGPRSNSQTRFKGINNNPNVMEARQPRAPVVTNCTGRSKMSKLFTTECTSSVLIQPTPACLAMAARR